MTGSIRIRPLANSDWERVAAIYAAGIATGNATFETSVPGWETWDAGHLGEHRFVAVTDQDDVVGWVAMSPVSDRCAYAGVAEHSVYVDPRHHGHGIGRTLLEAMIASSEAGGIWTVQTGIFPENAASLALHERAGFRVVGRRERIGRLAGEWRDTLMLERRSQVVGD